MVTEALTQYVHQVHARELAGLVIDAVIAAALSLRARQGPRGAAHPARRAGPASHRGAPPWPGWAEPDRSHPDTGTRPVLRERNCPRPRHPHPQRNTPTTRSSTPWTCSTTSSLVPAGRMRPGRPVDRGPGCHRVPDRGRRRRPQPQGQDPRCLPAAVQVRPGLGLLLQPGARPHGTQAVHAPRQDDRRLVVDQRHARSRQQRRLRRLGQGRSRGLVLRRGPSLLPLAQRLLPRSQRLPPRPSYAQRHRPPQPDCPDPGHHRCRGPGGDPLQRRLQRRRPGGRGVPAGHPEERQALVRRRRLAAPGNVPQEPHRAHRPPGPGRGHRGRPGNRCLGVDRQRHRGRAGRT